MKDTTILHSDMNCFYASVEMMLNPGLRNKAVAVCGATEDRHGIVLAKSERAKKAGVKTGMVNWEAKRLCPDLILVPPQYDQYLKYSKLAHEIYYRYRHFYIPPHTVYYKIIGRFCKVRTYLWHSYRKETVLTKCNVQSII